MIYHVWLYSSVAKRDIGNVNWDAWGENKKNPFQPM